MVKHGIEIPTEEWLADFCARHRVHKLSFFGSFTRDDFGPESDIDVLVEFKPEAGVGLFELAGMEEELAAVMGGRRVEINTPNSLSPYFRDRVLTQAEEAYAAT
jgi:predicted nucleotidyltransferase